MANLKLKKGPLELQARVQKPGFCCVCGGCVGLCPYFLVMQEHVVLMEPCGLSEGRCYEVCPRTAVEVEELNREVFGRGREDFILGTHRGVFMSQAEDLALRERGQYGATVSALLIHGLETGKLDAALISGTSSRYPLLPEPMIARTPEEVLEASGSKYTACPTLALLDAALRSSERLAVAGRPCQVIALRKRLACEPELKDKIALVVGLFCMWALDYRRLAPHLAKSVELAAARKIDIPYNRFVVVTDKGRKELEYEPIKALRNPTCDLCYDFTSEFADLSVGSTEWKDDWNTLIIRTEQGQSFVDSAREAGKLKVESLPEDRLELLRQASLGKKRRVLANLSQSSPVSDYLMLSPEERKAIENAGG